MFVALIAAFAAAASMILGTYWVVNRPQVAETRLRTLQREAIMGRTTEKKGGRRRQLNVRKFSVMPGGLMKGTADKLEAAGKPFSASTFWIIELISFIAFPIVVYFLLSLIGAHLSAIVMFLMFIAALIGAYAPFYWLRSRVASRQSALRKELPDVLDLVTLCVESGLGLDGAFRRVSQEMSGPLTAELQQMLHEVDLGKPRREALEDLAARNPIGELGAVTAAMIQSQSMGTSLSQTLRSQTQLLRLRRRQRAENTARQASVKMAFPLVLFLMPSLFLIVLGPIAINLFRALTD